ncbi:LOW QUALITY PROTEIN: extracellular matrix protein 2 [Aulostomus maculatus]
MRWWLVVAGLWLLVVLTISDAQVRNSPHNQGGQTRPGKRKRDGRGLGRARAGRSRPLQIRLIPGSGIPVEPGKNQGNTLFLESFKNVQESQSSYNIIPGKQGQCVYRGLTMFDQAVWSPKPCQTCLCTRGRVVCDEITCPIMHCQFPVTPAGECCPVCMEPDPDLSLDLSGDSPVHNDPAEPVTPLTQEDIQRILWREEEEHLAEEERLRKKDEEKKKRRKQRKEQAEKQRKIVEERRREEQEKLRQQVEREEEEWRRQIERAREEEMRRRQEEEERRLREVAEKEAREKERKQEEERRRQEEMLREELLAVEEEEEEEVWLRGDVFQMPDEEPEEPDLLPAPIPRPPAATEDELKEMEAEVEEEEEEEEQTEVAVVNRGGLPPGCDISDVTVTCENAKLIHFPPPPLAIPELKSLSLEGNNISSIPAAAFNGIPNLEWINLKKNKLTSAGIDATFKGLKMLSRLYLDGNLLESVPSNLPPTLQELKISENKLKGIQEDSFEDLRSLVTLELEGNLLSEGNVHQAFTPLTQLSYLRLGRNHFRTIPQGLPSSLLELHLENNLIEEISETVFNQTQSLNVVSLRHNRLDETRIAPMAWINHRNLESIDLSHNDLYLVPSYLPKSLVHLVLVGNNIERIPGYVFAHMDPGIEYLYLSYNKLDGEGIEPESFFGSYHSMVELCLDHNQLLSVPSGINEMTNLHFLRLNNNRIRSIPDEGICDPNHSGDSTLVALRLENNYIDPQKIAPTAFSCVRSSSSVVLKPQKTENPRPTIKKTF